MSDANVTIGVPVFNGAATLRRAVESALAQTHRGIRVVISDNASTDATPEIARELAASDPRITLIRQETNLGMSGNFGFVLRQARTEYYMWLASDDYIAPTYVERTLAALEADPTLVACVTRSLFVDADGTEQPARGTYPLLGDPVSNLAAYLSAPHDNTRIFGLYRTAALNASFPPRHFHAYDWTVAGGTLLRGKHMELPETLLIRDETPLASYIAAIPRDNPTLLGRIFPVLPMTMDLVLRQRIPLRWPIIKALVKLNLEMHAFGSSRDHPHYSRRVTRLLQRYLLWRLTTPPPTAASATQPATSHPSA